jgi:hypothetical protein
MKLFIALSAKKENLEAYSWSVYNSEREYSISSTGSTPINFKHPEVTFKKGDIFGVRTTRVNTTYLLKADSVHIPYVLPVSMKREYEVLMKRSMPYIGPPIDYEEIEHNFTRTRRVANPTATPNRQTADYFWRVKEPDEKSTIDKDNYQWRKINTGVSKIPVITKGQGRVKFHLLPGYIVGVRFFNNSRGGYILYGKDRIQIRRENYDDIIQNSRVLPHDEQQSGVIDRETGANDISKDVNSTGERGRRVRKSELDDIKPEDALVAKYNLNPDADLMEKTRLGSRRAQTTHLLKTIFNVDDLASLFNEKVSGDFEEEDDEPQIEEPQTEELEPEAPAPVKAEPAKKAPSVKAPAKKEPKMSLPPEFEDEDDEGEYYSGDDEEEEEEEDTGNLPKEGNDDAHAPVIDALIPGVIFTVLATKRKFAIIFSEPYESANGKVLDITKLTLHEIGDESVLYKVNIKNTMTEGEFEQVARIEPDDLPDSQLGKMQRDMEYLDVKPVALGKKE